ncbi:MAG: hypothetical protein Q9214_008052, partial [Letrouitia sp. 1 TL-2023]
DDDEDETAELLRELEKIKRERAEKQAQEVLQLSIKVDREKAAALQKEKERDIALGNPLLNPHKDPGAKRRADE